MGDAITILRCRQGRRATKLIRRAGQGVEILGYGAGAWFSVEQVRIRDLASLGATLDRTSVDPLAFVIRGEPLPGVDLRRCRRLLREQLDGTPPAFRERPRAYVIFDFDTVDEPLIWDWRDGALSGLSLRAKLPRAFHGVSFWWNFTASAGFTPGLRMRLAFWLGRPVSGEELDRWFASVPVDHAVFRPIQPIYVARPILRGVPDPVPVRSGIEWDAKDVVEVPALSVPAPVAPVEAAARRARLGSTPAARHGWPYAVLEQVARELAGTPPAGRNRWGGDGRHHALYCGSLRVSGLVRDHGLDPGGAVRVLAAAAARAGLGDAREVARTIRNGLRRGGLPA